QRAREALRRLAAGATHVDSDDFALGSHFESADADELARRFGDSPMARAPFDAPLAQWSGPLRSGFGWHLLRVTARAASQPATLAAQRERLRADWLADYREKDRQRRIDQLVAGHEIIRRDAAPAPAPAPAR
ncbi:MAG TPA: peptidylprolyl isomerase, partial [Steroidobacteraceae bacterium]|nr:peptidylprolyl isomerase [Steroidobacteraceae bacterium]